MDEDVLYRLSISLEYQLKIINLIKKMDDYLKQINLMVASHGDNWYEPYAIHNGYRDRKVSIQEKRNVLTDHLTKIRDKYYESMLKEF